MEGRWGVAMALPAILGLVLFTIIPLIGAAVISLTNWQVEGTIHFVGLQNYHHMVFHDPLFWKSLFETAYYTLGSVPLVIVLGFIAALLLNGNIRGRSVLRTIFYLPVVMPTVASSVLWLWIFNPNFGVLNAFLGHLGIPPQQWLFSQREAIPSLILMSTWGIGNVVVIFLAGLQNVPRHLLDAVAVDGGNTWHKFLHVTIPWMTPSIFFNLVLAMIGAFQTFNQVYIMSSGGPNYATYFYAFYVYVEAFTYGNLGYAAALSWVLFLIIAALSAVVFMSGKYWVFYEGGAN